MHHVKVVSSKRLKGPSDGYPVPGAGSMQPHNTCWVQPLGHLQRLDDYSVGEGEGCGGFARADPVMAGGLQLAGALDSGQGTNCSP